MRDASANPIDVVEAAYNLDSNDRDWLRGVAEAVRPLLDGGVGLQAYYFDVGTPPDTWHQHGVSFDLDPDVLKRTTDMVIGNPGIAKPLHLCPQPLVAAVAAAAKQDRAG